MGYYVLVVINSYLIYIITSILYEEVGLIFAISSVLVSFLFCNHRIGERILISKMNIDKREVGEMERSERALYLSFAFYEIALKAAAVMASYLTTGCIAILAFIIWMTSGKWFDGGLQDLLDSITLAKWFMEIYNRITGIIDKLIDKIINLEKKVYYFLKRRQIGEINGATVKQPKGFDEDEYFERKKQEYYKNIPDAREGDAKAQLIVGKYCITYIDREEGFKWIEKAAQQKEVLAYKELGNCYMKGIGTEKNIGRALQYYRLSVENKDPQGMYMLAEYYIGQIDNRKAIEIAFKLYYYSAKMGDSLSQAVLGKFFFKGDRVQKNYEVAYKWLSRAVEVGGNYVDAGYYLAQCYMYGWGTEKNERKGFEVLDKAVEEGCVPFRASNKLLSECYEKGIGVKKNREKALFYMKKVKRDDQIISELIDLDRE